MTIISAGGAVTGAGAAGPIDPREYFNTVAYTPGPIAAAAVSGTTGAVTGVGFQPDFVWIKSRTTANTNQLFDIVRGINTSGVGSLISNDTSAQSTSNLNGGLFSLDADGFTVVAGTDSGGRSNLTGANDRNYVAWNWKANGAGVSNTDGSITSTVSASTDSGFSIVTYTGTGSAGATVGHGLDDTPSMIIIKQRNTTRSWFVYHISIGNTGYIQLHLADAQDKPNSTIFNDAGPSPTTFTIGSSAGVNQSGGTYVAYCFEEIADFSKINSYTGNGSATGPSVTTGFQPTFLMIKRSDSTGDWIIHDSARDATNPRTAFLEWNTADVEGSGLNVDFNATGFQIKSSSATVNASGGTYIYMCIA